MTHEELTGFEKIEHRNYLRKRYIRRCRKYQIWFVIIWGLPDPIINIFHPYPFWWVPPLFSIVSVLVFEMAIFGMKNFNDLWFDNLLLDEQRRRRTRHRREKKDSDG